MPDSTLFTMNGELAASETSTTEKPLQGSNAIDEKLAALTAKLSEGVVQLGSKINRKLAKILNGNATELRAATALRATVVTVARAATLGPQTASRQSTLSMGLQLDELWSACEPMSGRESERRRTRAITGGETSISTRHEYGGANARKLVVESVKQQQADTAPRATEKAAKNER